MGLRTIDLHMPVANLVVGHSLRLPAGASLREAAAALVEGEFNWVVVEGDPEVMLTERDVCLAVAAGMEPDTPAVDAAGADGRMPLSVPAQTRIVEVAGLMLRRSAAHVLVEFSDGTVGVVPLASVLAVLLQAASPEHWIDGLQVDLAADPAEIWIG